MEEINKAYATFQERDRIASLGVSSSGFFVICQSN